ncbi:putative HXXXD-type acyl-transferase family protein, partial [Melia azedarach]
KMARIRVISTSSVCATNYEQPNLKIDLTPWDLNALLVDSIQKGLLFHKPQESDTNTIVLHLKNSLSRTLDFFPPLSGRLAAIDHDDDTVSFFINCNNDGALFIHAAAEGVSVADIIKPIYVPDEIVYSFFPLNGVKNFEGTSKPLLAVQLTELTDGIFIGCTINHTVVDGTSFWHFFNSWSQISRGFDSLPHPPVLQRCFLHNIDFPIHIPLRSRKQIDSKFILPPLQQRVFRFTAENIAKLKAKANDEIGTSKISSLQALLSHLWRSVVRNKCLDPDQEINYWLLIGVRPRWSPPMSPQYFGNAVQAGRVTLKAREVLGQGLGYVAWRMNEMVVMHREENLMDFLESWIENPRPLTMDSIVTNALSTSSSPRFNMYGNDFGWGKPIAVRSGPGNKFDGKITLFAGVEEGSVDIEACLSPETLQGLGNDAEFMGAVSVN